MANADDLRAQLLEKATTAVEQAVEVMVQDLRNEAPNATGETSQAIFSEPITQTTDFISYHVSSPTPQGEWVEDGTAPHLIVPINAKVLHWVGADGDVFAASVDHPGMPPRPWFHPITDAWADYLTAAYN